MKMFFRIIGVCCTLIAAISTVVFLSVNALFSLFFGLPMIAMGLALCALANVMDRVAFLEEKLNLSIPESDDELPQTTCPDCGREYDFDYPKCPYCGRTEAEGSVED